MHERFVDYLKDKNNDSLVGFVTATLTLDRTESTKTPQQLTREYDEKYFRSIKAIEGGITSDPSIFPEKCLEMLYISFTFLRREGLKQDFIALYETVETQDVAVLQKGILQSFRLYYFVYKYILYSSSNTETDYALLTQEAINGLINPIYAYSFSKSVSPLNDIKITNVTYADFVYKILKANKEKHLENGDEYKCFYNKALNAINSVLAENTLNSYALYYSIRAGLHMLGLELNIENEDTCDDIRKDLQKALQLENSTEAGLRKKTQYLTQLTELNMYETNKKLKEGESKIKEIESNSIKKFAAFSAFITFIFGFIGYFAKGKGGKFDETVGFLFVLFGVSMCIFTVFDLIVLGPLSLSFKRVNDNTHMYKSFEKRSIICFVIKAIIEIVIILSFILIGLHIGNII